MRKVVFILLIYYIWTNKTIIMDTKQLYIRTPLIESILLGEYLDERRVYLKLENTQPCGSFKLRGISAVCKYAADNQYKEVVTMSGGNAGLALAYASRKLGLDCHIVVPNGASQTVINTMRKYGARVEVYGETSADVNRRATQLIKENSNRFYVHPFDSPLLWTGHSTMVDEIAEDLGETPSLIITCCGGGGLLCGIIEGMRRHQWNSVPIIAMETSGTNSFNACVKSGGYPVTLDKCTGIALSLSPVRVCDQLAKYYRESSPPIVSHVVEDSDAVSACIKFANHHCFLVEPACGAALSAVYNGIARHALESVETRHNPVVVIVCGGCNVSIAQLKQWQNSLA